MEWRISWFQILHVSTLIQFIHRYIVWKEYWLFSSLTVSVLVTLVLRRGKAKRMALWMNPLLSLSGISPAANLSFFIVIRSLTELPNLRLISTTIYVINSDFGSNWKISFILKYLCWITTFQSCYIKTSMDCYMVTCITSASIASYLVLVFSTLHKKNWLQCHTIM